MIWLEALDHIAQIIMAATIIVIWIGVKEQRMERKLFEQELVRKHDDVEDVDELHSS